MRILQYAPAARAWLATAGPAHLLNVFDRACNLVDDRGQVLAIVTVPAALAPCAALAAAEAAAPFRGLSATSADFNITTGITGAGVGPVTANCPAGTYAVGGGAKINSTAGQVWWSAPTIDSGTGNPTGWQVAFIRLTSENIVGKVYVTCATITP